jgi:type III secretory pathway component EscV
MVSERQSRKEKQRDYLVIIGIILLVLGIIIFFSELFFIGILLAVIGALFILANTAKEPKVAQSQQHQIQECQSPHGNHDNASKRDPVLDYEVKKGHFGDPSKQSLTYVGKKTRWR